MTRLSMILGLLLAASSGVAGQVILAEAGLVKKVTGRRPSSLPLP